MSEFPEMGFSTRMDATVTESPGEVSVKLRKVKPGEYVWMVYPPNPKICHWIHPDEVEKKKTFGYEVRARNHPGVVIKQADKKPDVQPGFYNKKHQGKTIYILGTGTSLTPAIGRKLMSSGAITIGVNDIFRLCKPTFAPTYHIHCDYNKAVGGDQFSTINREGLDAMKKYGTHIFSPLRHDQTPTTDIESDFFYSDPGVAFASHYDMVRGELRLGHSSTTIFHALQLAIILGGSPIILLGVDFYLPKTGDKIHFYPEYHDLKKKIQKKYRGQEEKALDARRRRFESDLKKKALPTIDELSIMVINGNPKSKLETFVKMDAGKSL